MRKASRRDANCKFTADYQFLNNTVSLWNTFGVLPQRRLMRVVLLNLTIENVPNCNRNSNVKFVLLGTYRVFFGFDTYFEVAFQVFRKSFQTLPQCLSIKSFQFSW